MKHATEMKHAQSVRAVALLERGEVVGKIIGHWSDNPAGSVVTVSLFIYGEGVQTARAGGYGYDKYAAALDGMTFRGERISCHGAMDAREWFTARGVTYCEVL